MITCKPSVRIIGLSSALAFMLYKLEQFHFIDYVSQPQDLVITSINDSAHGPKSRHYRDEALDLRSKSFHSTEEKEKFASELEKFLGSKFRVLLENLDTDNEHFHIQVKKGLSYP